MLTDLVLLAPCGILKSARLGVFARLANAGWVPSAVAGYMATRRTHKAPSAEVAAARLKGADAKDRRTVVDVEGVVEWQGARHRGYLGSFLSSFRTGPIFDREEEWGRVGEVWRREGKRCLVIIGKEDEVVDPKLLGEMVGLLGGGEERGERVVGRLWAGIGHDFVVRRGGELAGELMEFWEEGWGGLSDVVMGEMS